MFLSDPPLTEDLAASFERERREDGFVMNLSRLWAWRQDVSEAFLALRKQLLSQSSLTPREQAVTVCAAVSAFGDAYCSMAWGARLGQLADLDTAVDVLAGRAAPALTSRERALAQWARAVARCPNDTRAEDVEALRAAGLGEREIFEATVLAAFRLAFSTVNDALGVQPDAQLHERLPAALKAVVQYGRPPAPAQ